VRGFGRRTPRSFPALAVVFACFGLFDGCGGPPTNGTSQINPSAISDVPVADASNETITDSISNHPPDTSDEEVQATIENLSLSLINSDASSKHKAIEVLSQFDNNDAVHVLALALDDRDSQVRYDAVEAIADTSGFAAIGYLERALLDHNRHVREAAVDGIAEIGGPVSSLTIALYDEDPGIREEVVFVLGELGGTDAVALLHRALVDEHIAIRQAASQTLSECLREGRCPR